MTEKEVPSVEELPTESEPLGDADLEAVIGGFGGHGKLTVGEAV